MLAFNPGPTYYIVMVALLLGVIILYKVIRGKQSG